MKLTVKRYDPTKDDAPYTVDYEVPSNGEYMTLLEGLMYIHENYEPLAFDFACRGRLCGRCAMMLDGVPVLACVEPLKDGSHVIEPLAGMPVIRDLIVDKSRAHKKLEETYERVRFEPIDMKELQTFNMEVQDDILDVEHCCRCQVCTAGCPAKAANPSYIGPSRMLAVAFRHFDPYDQSDRILEAVQGGLWDCLMCGNCDKVCNALEIDHMGIWKKLRDAAEARGLKPKQA